jgi:predicted dehydrogenase
MGQPDCNHLMSAKLGIVGCGHVSQVYLRNIRLLEGFEVVAVSDADVQRARARGRAGVPRNLLFLGTAPATATLEQD